MYFNTIFGFGHRVARSGASAGTGEGCFFKRAFNDMKESTRRQREIDRANFKAHKLEAKASFQEHKAQNSRKTRKAIEEKEYEKQMQEAKARQEAAEKRIEKAKQAR